MSIYRIEISIHQLSVSGERDEHWVLVKCLIKPDLGIKKNQDSQSTLEQNSSLLLKCKFQSVHKIKHSIVLQIKPSRLFLK